MREVKSQKLTRREQSKATKLRIIKEAHRLFAERGYGGTRMSDVAQAAGLAVQTVYFAFHTKGELLQACYELAVLGEEPLPPPQQPWFQSMMSAKSGTQALRHFAEGNTAIVARVGILDDVIKSTPFEPDAFEVRERGERLRRAGYREIVVHLSKKFGLKKDLTTETATDILLTLGGGSTYRSLVLDYGWSYQQFVDWLHRTLTQVLLSRS